MHVLAKLLESGEIPFITIDGDKLIPLGDLLACEEAARMRRRAALAELARESVRDGSFFKIP